MPGWPDSLPAAAASVSTRRWFVSPNWPWYTLTATSRFSDDWRAFQTTAWPPRASGFHSPKPQRSGCSMLTSLFNLVQPRPPPSPSTGRATAPASALAGDVAVGHIETHLSLSPDLQTVQSPC